MIRLVAPVDKLFKQFLGRAPWRRLVCLPSGFLGLQQDARKAHVVKRFNKFYLPIAACTFMLLVALVAV